MFKRNTEDGPVMGNANVSFVFFSLLLLLLFHAGAGAQQWGSLFTAKVYLGGSNRGELLFTQENSIEQNGKDAVLVHSYFRTDGTPATVEKVTIVNGEFSGYDVEFTDSDCGCRLDRKGDSVTFSFTRGNTAKKGVRAYERTLVTGPTLNKFIIDNWTALRSGKRVEFHFPAMPFQQIVRFHFDRHDKSPFARDGTVVLKMDVNNVFIRLFVDPVDLVLDAETGRLLEIHGKSLLERVVEGKKENPVVDIYYTYEK